MAVAQGNEISVEYEGRLDDGEVFDTSSHGDHSHPLTFVVGSGQVIKGFDDAVMGMALNEEKEFTLTPEEAYGERHEQLMKDIPRDQLPKDQEPQTGMTLVMMTPEGQQIPAQIAEVGEESVKIDLNHPLAGKNLTFKIKVTQINEKPTEASAAPNVPAETDDDTEGLASLEEAMDSEEESSEEKE